jgi:phage I-like protein
MKNRIHFELQEMEGADIEWVQLIRTGKFNHALFGKFDINKKVLREFKANFDNKVRGVDIAVDYFHESLAEAAGWIREIELRENDKQLWIKVDWTPKAEERILEKEIRYISADFDLDYADSETGIEYGATLYGAGLTNRPHVKGMKAIFSDEIVGQSQFKLNNNEDTNMAIDFNEMLASVGELSEDEKLQLGEKLGFSVKTSEADAANAKKLADANTATKLAEKLLSDKESSIKTLSETVKNLVAANEKKDKEVKFNEMLTNGKVVEAQREAYTEGDMAKFAENAVSGINLSGQGSGASNSDEAATAEIKLNELASTKVADTGISFSEAYKAVAKENADLVAKVNA